MTTRSYRQICPVARALDVVGERWTLLVVRELLLGPKRFKELLERLPAMGTNRLSGRLKTLTANGLVERRALTTAADVSVYALTPLGEDLRPLVFGLAVWGSKLAPDRDVDPSSARAELIALALAAQSAREASAGVHESYEFHVGRERFHVAVDDGCVRAQSGPSPRPPVIQASCDVRTFAELGLGRLSPSRALRTGRARVAGPPPAFTRAFRLLAPAAA